MKPFLSLCMIVRNEENTLEKCLSSAAPHVDEIIIADTGSTDATKQIASKFTASIYDVPWNDNFAEARNAAVAMATAPWILMLDADEYLDVHDLSALRTFLGQLPSASPVGIVVPIYNFVGEAGAGKVSMSQAMRIFSRHEDLRFERPIHEQLVSRAGNLTELEFPLTIYHAGYTAETIRTKNKNVRNQQILAQMRASGRFSAYDAFLMGNEYFSQDQFKQALECYREADQPSQRNKSWLPICVANSVSCMIHLNQYTDAYRIIQRAIRRWPAACDFHWLQGYLLAQVGFDEQAIASLQECLRIANLQSDSPNWLISPNHGSTLPLQQLAVLHLRWFQVPEAVQCLTRLLYVNPSLQAALTQLLRLIRVEDLYQIRQLLQSLYPAPEPILRAMIGESALQAGLSALAAQYGVSADTEGNLFQRPPSFPNPDPTVIANECMRLFRSGQYDAFDRLVGRHPQYQSELAQLLGNAFFADHQFELALDYYSLLLNQNRLDALGYENLARLYFVQGEIAEGADFLRQAIRQAPERLELYVLYASRLNRTPDTDEDAMLMQMIEYFPGMRDFPLFNG